MIVPRFQRKSMRFASAAAVVVAWACSAHAADPTPNSGDAFLKVLLTRQTAKDPSALLEQRTATTVRLIQLESLLGKTPATLREIGKLQLQLTKIEHEATNQALQIAKKELQLQRSIFTANYQASAYERAAGTPTR
jgi:hypothetical protein